MIRGEWVISFAKSHSRECALPMKATPKAVSITANTKMNFAHCTRLSWLLPAKGRLLCKVIINKIHQLVNPYNKKKHAVWMILYTGPFGYNGAAPPILDRIADDTPSPLLQPGAVYNS